MYRAMNKDKYIFMAYDGVDPSYLYERLPAGIYKGSFTDEGPCLVRTAGRNDEIVELGNPEIDTILNEVETFRKSEHKYKEYGVVYKRGILLWGPPGNGKSGILHQLKDKVVKDGGVVMILRGDPATWNLFIDVIRSSEKDRFILCISEDIDRYAKDDDFTDFLEGQTSPENFMFIGTTNYPEVLPDRLVRRPGRFDSLVYVGNPNDRIRRKYLVSKVNRFKKAHGKSAPKSLCDELEDWVKETEGFSLAEIKEVILAKEVLGYSFKQIHERKKVVFKNDGSTNQQDNSPEFRAEG